MKTNALKQKVEQAINDIINYETLPSQIDYRVREKAKAEEANDFLNTLPKGLCQMYSIRIETAIELWHTPLACGQSPSELDDMF